MATPSDRFLTPMKSPGATKRRYVPVGITGLYKREPGGVYQLRTKFAGRTKWVSLRTKSLRVARERMDRERPAARRKTARTVSRPQALCTMGDLQDLRLQQIELDPRTRWRTKAYYRLVHREVEATWPGFRGLAPDKSERAFLLALGPGVHAALLAASLQLRGCRSEARIRAGGGIRVRGGESGRCTAPGPNSTETLEPAHQRRVCTSSGGIRGRCAGKRSPLGGSCPAAGLHRPTDRGSPRSVLAGCEPGEG